MSSHRALAAASGLVAILVAAPARADIAAPSRPPSCSPATEEHGKFDCVECAAAATDSGTCQRNLGKDGFEKACRNSGRESWTEVWCRSPEKAAMARTATPESIAAAAEAAKQVRALSVSSTAPSVQDRRFDVGQLTDGQIGTTWRPDRPKLRGVGEWVKVEFKDQVTVRGIVYADSFPADDKEEGTLRGSAQVKTARIEFSSGKSEKIEIPNGQHGLLEITFTPRQTRSIRLVVDALQPAPRWWSLSISELGVLLAK